MPELYDKLTLNVVDALICQYQGEERGFLQYSSMMKELRMSRDPVALDVLSMLEINRQRKRAGLEENASALQLYQNANLLELGESDVSRIRFERVTSPDDHFMVHQIGKFNLFNPKFTF
jgi:hypothetical protein